MTAICICGHAEHQHAPTGRRACVVPNRDLKACPCLAWVYDHDEDDTSG